MLKQTHEALAAGWFYSMGLGDLPRGGCDIDYLVRDHSTKDARARVTSLLCVKPETSGTWTSYVGE